MKTTRNKEFRIQILLYAVFGFLCTVAGFFLDYRCGLLVLLAALLFAGVNLFFLKRRYDAIARLSESIDRILHDPSLAPIEQIEEGELSILQSEIGKMTLRLREQTDQLQKDKKFLADTIADIFHQMRTPLTSMQLLLTLLEDKELSNEKRVELTRSLKRLLERMHWMVETLLKMSKIDAGTAVFKKEEISVDALVRRAAEPLLIPMELKEQRLFVQGEDVRFTGDFLFCAEALSNILKNCMEHTPAGGTVSILASDTALYTEIVVYDNGEGFDKTDLPYLFDRFYKGKNASEGSIGIGLALARMIVAAQSGTLTAQNRKEGGAQFTIRFYKSVV